MGILKKIEKRSFDVLSKEDLEHYKFFLENSSWGSRGCPFKLEEPYLSVPTMIEFKITERYLSEKLEC